MVDYYETLNVARDADEETIRSAGRRARGQCHPDRAGGGESDEDRIRAVNEAMDVLLDPKLREAYDARPSEVERRLRDIWIGFLERGHKESGNAIDTMLIECDSAVQSIEAQRSEWERSLARLKSLERRITYRGDGRNMFVEAVAERRHTLERQIAAANDEIDKLAAMREAIMQYTDCMPVHSHDVSRYRSDL